METVDEEFLGAAKDFIKRNHSAGGPWFCYFNSTRMHVFTHLKKESQGKTGLGLYPDGMVEHDGHVGQLLALVDELGIADNTIVVYTTDNGAECFTWPDGGSTPFKGEKATNWEGGFRVPCAIRWPGVIKPGTIVNDICAHEDFLPTLGAAAGDADVVARVKKGGKIGDKSFKVHLDGNNLIPFLKGEEKESPREGFMYWSDDGDLMAVRVRHWKVAFLEQNTESDLRHRSGSGRASSLGCARPFVQPALRSVRARHREHLLRRLGRPTGCSCSCPRRQSLARYWRLSRSSRRAPRLRASPSATRWRRSRRRARTRTDAGQGAGGTATGRQRRCRPVRGDSLALRAGLVALEVLREHQPAHFRMPVPGDLPVDLELGLGGRALAEGNDFLISHSVLEQQS